MQFSRACLTGVALLGVAACSDDPISKEVAPVPSAAVRFVNAIADTVPMDYRFTSIVSNASEPNIVFQTSNGNWRPIPAGNHQLSAFFAKGSAAGQDVGVVSKEIDKATFNLEASKKYTVLHYGFAKAGATPQKSLKLIEDVPPTVPAGQVAIRVINAAPAFGNINVYAQTATATGAAVSGTPAFANVAPGAVTAWVNFPVATGTSTYRMTATSTANTTIAADFLAPAGVAAVAATATTGALDAVAGTRQATSAITIVVFGPRVAHVLTTPTGTTSAVTATTTGAMAALLDAHPAKISP